MKTCFQRLIVLFCLTGFPVATTAQEAEGPVVLTTTVSVQDIRPTFQHPARIEAIQTHSVRPFIRSRITAIHFTAGEVVGKGDLLAELDTTDFDIAVAEAEANLKETKANALKVSLDLDRAQRLVASNTVSRRELEYVEAQADVSDAELSIAESKLERAKNDLKETRINAPFAGRISAPNYSVGDIIGPSDPTLPAPLAEIVSLDPIYAVGAVDQANYFEFLARRLELTERGASIPPLELHIILPGGSVYLHTGTFENWDNTATASTGTISARIVFPNPDGTLLPGENVTIRGAVIDPISAPLVPQRAVSFDQIGHFVWVVGADGGVARRNVTLGIRHEASWTVQKGLSEGDVVVVEGLQNMRPGLVVTPKPFEG
ncbi:efflux RND transporter periplasmic adaptor subunit [Heliomarina baculiformis]|uniref:efflux RND transporter periplasmic adaptor subunit n=1 Tax=Heliomarina baculiformis TaxID=2872036 RepID=UPI001EE369E7|nr:efflux RND transporter periplasmic adaptor subunit [Heliomarina baculiformis]